MPERDPEAGHSSRLLRGLIWAGVLLAPLAAVVVLLGQSSGSVRFAVLLIAVSVVLVGSAMLVRSDPELQRGHVEERVAEEVEALRVQLRAEFGHGGAAPPPAPTGFFQDEPMAYEDDPFAAGPPPHAPAPGFAPAPAPGFASGGRASVQPSAPAAARPPGAAIRPASVPPPAAAVRPPGAAARPPGAAARPPGAAVRPPGAAVRPASVPPPEAAVRPEPGMTSGARQPSIPRQRGAASIPVPPSSPASPPRASAAVRPGSTQYGSRPEHLDDDFGASNGYADVVSGNVYAPGGTYGAPPMAYDEPSGGFEAPGYGNYGTEYGYAGANGYGPDGEEYSYDNGYAPAPNVYGSAPQSNVYGRPDEGYGPENGYDTTGYDATGGDPTGGDPTYRARRHRPSANDTNIGTMADFAEYEGWQPDERYVQDYGRR
jgi:hypothetical protein